MKRSAAFAALTYTAVMIFAAAALSGCDRQTAGSAAHSANGAVSHTTQSGTDSVASRGGSAADYAHAANPKDMMRSSSSEKPVGKSEAAELSVQAPKPKVDAKDAYKEGKPTLLGLALKTPKDVVLSKLGATQNKFVMDDDTDPITVYDYPDFSVGFNKKDTLEFVDVKSADIDPGLRGLRLGQKLADALDTLGKPDTNTSYVLTYKSEGTVLKLDLDPKNATIRSIKLFPSP